MDKVIDNTTGFHFTIIDNYILNYASLNALEQIIYIHLKQHSIYSNKCFPGINKLAEAIGLSPNTVRKALKGLKIKGFVDINQRFNSSNEYTLLAYPEFTLEIKNKGLEQEEKEKGIAMVLLAYQNNINPVCGSMERDKLIMWYETFENNGDIIVKAIELSILQGVRKIKYIESILINWQDNGIKTLKQCEAYQKEWDENRRGNKDGGYKKNKGDNTEDRYDFSKFSNL